MKTLMILFLKTAENGKHISSIEHFDVQSKRGENERGLNNQRKKAEREEMDERQEINEEFKEAFIGIQKLPKSSRFGVYLSYVYFKALLKKVQRKSVSDLLRERIRIPNGVKMLLFAKSYIRNSLNII